MRITSEEVSLSWEVVNPKADYLFLGVYLVWQVLIFVSVALDNYINPADGMWISSLAIVIFSFGFWMALPICLRKRQTMSPLKFTAELPHTDLPAVDRVGDHFVITTTSTNGKRTIYPFRPCHVGDADALEAALLTPGEDAHTVSFPVSFGPSHLQQRNPSDFFGRGTLLIEGNEVTLSGRRGDSGPRASARRITIGLCYLGLVFATYVLYPVIFEPLFANDFKGPIVLLTPMLLVLILMSIVLPLIPLFITQSRTVSTTDISDLRRLGRQITFTAPDGASGKERYTFHLKTADGAEAVALALGGHTT